MFHLKNKLSLLSCQKNHEWFLGVHVENVFMFFNENKLNQKPKCYML